MGKRRMAREAALQILFQLDITKDPPEQGMELFWATHEQPKEVKDFANQLAGGALEHLAFLDQCISLFSENWSITRMPTVDRNILRLAAYEILFLPEIPDKVSINEALEIAKDYGTDESVPFINGILDKIAKEKERLLQEADKTQGRQ
ncbi:MAG: transcription antitermination factor NusB [bacterium]|nr:transcription antitermination factor NusB [bacterium]